MHAPSDPLRLFGEHFLEAFAQGESAQLIARRNPNLGSLLNTERAPAYVQILHRLLFFRREHELEPLHEDIHLAVKEAQEFWSNEAYGVEIFNLDMAQLLEWKLLVRRLEKERIRGYKDNRRTRFRYRLTEEAIAFLEWLEDRLRSDLEDRAADARDLLEEVQGSFNELLRMLKDARNGGPADSRSEGLAEAEARRILFQVHKADQCTRDINSALSDFNAALLGFLGREYTLGELRGLLGSLERYVEKYLLQVVRIRASLLPTLERAAKPKYREILVSAFEIMERERKEIPRMLKASAGERMSPLPLLAGLQAFYREGGALDGLCRRTNESALRVWRKMSSHLKELERKSHRLEDIRERIAEMASLEPMAVPRAFLNRLLSWGSLRSDMHEWNEDIKATPPAPRRSSWKGRPEPALRLQPKLTAGNGPAQSLEEARMAELKAWLEAKVLGPDPEAMALVSQGGYEEPEDFPRILALAKAGILGRGRNLARIGFRLHADRQNLVEVRLGTKRSDASGASPTGASPTCSAGLFFHEMELRKSEAG
ncbi:MAG: DUF2397 family protein [Fibrobacteria bacterium]